MMKRSKDYSLENRGKLISNLKEILKMLNIDISDYCDVNIGFSVKDGKFSERIDTNIHHIHKPQKG